MRSIVEGVIIGICLAAITASAKAIVDVASLKQNTKNNHEIIKEMRQDIRDIHKHLLGE